MKRVSIKLIRKAPPFASDGTPTFPPNSSFSSSSSSLQLVPEQPPPKPQSNPLYSFLPLSRNPNNIVNLISSSLKQQPVIDLSLLHDEIKDLLPHLGPAEISRVLLRCQSDSVSALSFFNWVKNDLGRIPTTHNYCLIVHILAWSKEFKPAMKLLTELIQSVKDDSSSVFDSLVLHSEDCNWDPVVFDMLIKAHVKVGRVKEGFTTFMKIMEFGSYVPTVSSCNCLLNGLLKSNSTAQCWQVYDEMVRLCIHPNSFTFNILTHAFCNDGDVSKVNEFLEKMEEEGFEPDIVTYNTLISSYCRKGKLADAYYLYKIMYRRGVLPDLVSYTALMNGLCKEGKMKEALQFFHRMVHRGLNPDVVAYNTLIFGYCKEGRIQEAKSLLYQMIANGIRADSFTCRVLIRAYVEDGRLVSALNLAVELEKFDASISWDVYDYLIVRLCEEDKPFAAKSLLERKCRDGYKPDMLIYEKLVESLSTVNSLADALLLKSEMVCRNGKPPSVATYKALIAGLCRTGGNAEAEALMDEMIESGMVPDREICRALISGYCKERAVGKAESLLESFAKEFDILDNESYNEVARIACEDGDAGKLMDLQERMLKVGYAPSSITFKYTIKALWRTVGLKKEKETYKIAD